MLGIQNYLLAKEEERGKQEMLCHSEGLKANHSVPFESDPCNPSVGLPAQSGWYCTSKYIFPL